MGAANLIQLAKLSHFRQLMCNLIINYVHLMPPPLTCFPFSRPRKSGKFPFSGLSRFYGEKADEEVEVH
jgi:hypothetical protein